MEYGLQALSVYYNKYYIMYQNIVGMFEQALKLHATKMTNFPLMSSITWLDRYFIIAISS